MCRLPKPLLCNATDDLLLHSFFTKHFVSPVFNYCFQFQTCWRASSRASSSFRLSREHSLVFSSRWSWLLWMVLSRLAMTVSRSLFWLPASSSFLQDDTKKQTTNGYNNDYQHAFDNYAVYGVCLFLPTLKSAAKYDPQILDHLNSSN